MRRAKLQLIKVLLGIVCLFSGYRMTGQSKVFVDVDVNLNVKHSVDTVSEFDRKKYINLHADLTDGGWDSNAQRDQFLDEYDVYLGRNNGSLPWQLDQLDEDPNKKGWPFLIDMTNRGNSTRNSYASKVAVHKHEHRSDMMIGGQPVMYPNGDLTNPCCGNATPWVMEGHDALAEYMANFLTKYFGSGGSTGEPRPTYLEVMNEPFVGAWEIPATKAEISELHNVVANRIHELTPEVLVGGYTSAWPEHNAGDFAQWNDNWKLFIDIAGANMDFFSVHLYDNSSDFPDGNSYRVGANAEAVLDLIEHYSYLTLGEVKPFNISEYGNFTRSMTGTPYTKERDWANLRSFSSLMMGFLEKPNLIIKSMPFVLLKATWWSHESGNKYPHRLLRQKYELEGETGTEWVYTELVKFFELWSDVKGTRIDTHPNDPDIQADAFVNGKKVYVILNNLHFKDQPIKLNLFDDYSNPLELIRIKHLHLDGDLPVLDSTSHTEWISEIELGREATMILEYSFTQDVVIDQTSGEEKLYADKYLQPIEAGVENLFLIVQVNKGSHGEAMLRLGVGRDHSRSLRPVVLVNGTPIEVPWDCRGYDQKTRDGFFGILEIPVPYDLLEESNTISVTFEDGGGHISSVSMQTFDFSKALVRTPRQTRFDASFTVIDKTSDLTIEGVEVIFAGYTAYTDATGIVVFDSIAEGTYLLSAATSEYFSYSNPSFAHYDYTTAVIKLEPRTFELGFLVLEEDLEIPVYGASLEIANRSLLTNDKGMTGMALTAGSYPYSISEPYFRSVSGVVSHKRDTLVKIGMERMLADVKFRIFSHEGNQRERDAVLVLNDTSIISNALGLATFKGLQVDTVLSYSVLKDRFFQYEGEFSMKQDTTIEVNLLLNSLNGLFSLPTIRVYPNPVTDILSIDTGGGVSGSIHVNVTDVLGRIVLALRENLNQAGGTYQLVLSRLEPGFYMVTVGNGSDSQIFKIFKQ